MPASRVCTLPVAAFKRENKRTSKDKQRDANVNAKWVVVKCKRKPAKNTILDPEANKIHRRKFNKRRDGDHDTRRTSEPVTSSPYLE